MLPFRRVAAFFARLVLLYGLFVIAWPGVRTAYAAFFRAGGNAVFKSLMPRSSIRCHPGPDPGDAYDTYVNFTNPRSGVSGTLPLSSREGAYLQTGLLVSLVLATPLPWRRRLWALLWGLVLVNAALACNLVVYVLHTFASRSSLLELTAGWERVVQVAYQLVMIDVVSLWPLPVLVWILVSYRRTDWAKWVRADAEPGVQRAKGRTGR